jgi:HEAT repeat protein
LVLAAVTTGRGEEVPSPLELYLAELRDLEKQLVTSKLSMLSDLAPEEMALFSEAWPDIDVARRRQVLKRLVNLAEDNLELDFDGVFRFCISDADGEVKTRAIEGLWECTDHSLIDHLTGLVSEDEEDLVRESAVVGLGKFVLLAELSKLSEEDTGELEQTLLAVLGNTNERINLRCRALEAISPLSKPYVEDLIRDAYYSESRELQASALYGMGQNCHAGWLPILLKELHSPYPRFRFEATKACGELETEEAVPRLSELIEDDDAQVSLAAIEALGQIGGSAAKAVLEQCLDNPIESIREAAQDALEVLGFWEEPFRP